MTVERKRPLVIAVAGGSASGKGFFVQRLQVALGDVRTSVFPMDRYFRKPLPTCMAPFSGRTYEDYNQPESVDMDRLISDIRACVKDREAEVVVIEGLLALQNDVLRDMSDLKIFVDADPDERIVRRLKRNMAEKGLDFDTIADYYLDSVRFRHQEFVEPSRWHADIILNGSRWSDRALELVVVWVRCNMETTEV